MPFIVDNKQINTPIKDLVGMLKQQCILSNIPKLSDMYERGNNLIITCPVHKDGQEAHPSCSVLLEDRSGVFAGTVHCFSCGYRASFVKFVADCLGCSIKKAIDWVLGVSNYTILENTRDVSLELFEQKKVWEDIVPVSNDELNKYEYIHPYMYKRGLTDELIQKFDVGYDKETESLTFPVYVNGVCMFVARRNVNYKRFDLPKLKPKPIYGLDYITGNEIYVCESILNALTCWKYGKQAVALFGTGTDFQLEQLKAAPQRRIVLALDGDKAGKAGSKKLFDGLTNKIVTILKTPEDGRDINDLSKEEFGSLEESFFS